MAEEEKQQEKKEEELLSPELANAGTQKKQEQKEAESPKKPQKKSKDTVLLYAIIVLFLAVGAMLVVPKLVVTEENLSLDELHERNMQGKLDPKKGYVYNQQYSFVFFDGLWYGLIPSARIEKIFSIPFHYGPREVEHITPVGTLNRSNLDRYSNFFNTFYPLDDDLGYIAASTAEANSVFTQAFGKGVIGSCTTNESSGCTGRPIVQCNSTDAPVFYFSSEDETNVIYLDNCAIISGKGEELFKATDRMLFDLLGIIP